MKGISFNAQGQISDTSQSGFISMADVVADAWAGGRLITAAGIGRRGRSPMRGAQSRDPLTREQASSPVGEVLFVDGQMLSINTGAGLMLEYMDVSFAGEQRAPYKSRGSLLEILALESVAATNRSKGRDSRWREEDVRHGFSCCLHHDAEGELVFNGQAPVRGLRVIANERFIADSLLRHTGMANLLGRASMPSLDGRPMTGEVGTVLRQIVSAMARGFASPVYYECKLVELLLLATGSSDAMPPKPRFPSFAHDAMPLALSGNAVSVARRLLADSLSSPPSIAELAIATSTSATKLQADFKDVCGCTIHAYLTRLRMLRAQELMRTTDMPLYCVAREVGYRKAGHFSKVFKQFCGVCPQEFRAAGVFSLGV